MTTRKAKQPTEPIFVPIAVDMEKVHCKPENAGKYKLWLAERGGLAIWDSLDLCDPGRTWTSPVRNAEGQENGPPNWKCGPVGTKPKIVTDPADVLVVIDGEVDRFEVKLMNNGCGQIVLTKRSSEKVNKIKDRIGKGCYHVFTEGSGLMFGSDTVIILAPEKAIPLADFDHEAWERENQPQQAGGQ